MIRYPNIGDKLICPVCEKEFTVSDDTKYLVKSEFTCSWKCFLKYVNKTQTVESGNRRKTFNPITEVKKEEPKLSPVIEEEQPVKRKRGRPRKVEKVELW